MSAVREASRPRATDRGKSAPRSGSDVRLPCRVRLVDGRTFTGELPAHRHRALQLGMLHANTAGLVELAVGFRRNGKLVVPRVKYSEFLPGGKAGGDSWLKNLLAAAERQSRRPGGEVFVAPPARAIAHGRKEAVTHTQTLWLDIDRPGQLHRLWTLLAERPCHLLVESGGSGGAHAYFLLEESLPATRTTEETGEVVEPIERAHLRLIYHLGLDEEGKAVGDRQCQNRSRLMRLAGTVNGKTGRYARIIEANFELPRYRIQDLVGDLPDPPGARIRRPGRQRAREDPDPYKRIPPFEYAELLGGTTPDRNGFIRCPAVGHEDRRPSAHVGDSADEGWHCFSCGAGGSLYDFASALLGGPTGSGLRGDAFRRAREYVVDVFGDLRAETGR